jgi:sn-glycerol 3-phosphate transport system permease protein
VIERTPVLDGVTHLTLALGVLLTGLPLYYALVASTLPVEEVTRIPMPLIPGDRFLENAALAWRRLDLGTLLLNTTVVATMITVGKIAISMAAAFALVYFQLRIQTLAFWLIFCSLMLPIEVRIVPTYEVMGNVLTPLHRLMSAIGLAGWAERALGYEIEWRVSMLNTYTGLVLPLIASATATFLFRQFFLTVPEDLAEAAKMDGAGPVRFFFDVLLPLSRTNIAALSVIMFVYGWNQYLWPLLMTTDNKLLTVGIGLSRIIPGIEGQPNWHIAMAAIVMITVPPILLVVFLQRSFVKGLMETER